MIHASQVKLWCCVLRGALAVSLGPGLVLSNLRCGFGMLSLRNEWPRAACLREACVFVALSPSTLGSSLTSDLCSSQSTPSSLTRPEEKGRRPNGQQLRLFESGRVACERAVQGSLPLLHPP